MGDKKKKKFRIASRAVIINDDNEFLLVRQKNNWAIAGGGLDFGENLEQNLSREIEEELGVKAIMDKIIFVQDFLSQKNDKNKHHIEFFCTIKNNSDFIDIEKTYKNATHSHELKKIGWFKLEDFPKNFKPVGLKKVLENFLKDKKNFCVEYVSGI